MIKFHSDKEQKYDVNLTPMLDIIFNLLIFFLIAAVVSIRGLQMNLPDATNGEGIPKTPFVIAINVDKYYINDVEVEKSKIKTILKHKFQTEKNMTDKVVLKVSKSTQFENVIWIVDLARGIGLQNIVFATNKKSVMQ